MQDSNLALPQFRVSATAPRGCQASPPSFVFLLPLLLCHSVLSCLHSRVHAYLKHGCYCCYCQVASPVELSTVEERDLGKYVDLPDVSMADQASTRAPPTHTWPTRQTSHLLMMMINIING